MDHQTALNQMILDGRAPPHLSLEGFITLQKGYLQPDETPRGMYKRISEAAAKHLKKPELAEVFYKLIDSGKLGPASPIASNFGTERGLPISCNSIHVGDSVDSIFDKTKELAVLSKNGAGVGIYLGDIRGRGAKIKGNGTSEGVIPWARVYDTTTSAVSQGSTRRGASALYLPIEHSDIHEFLKIRRANQEESQRCLNSHHAVCLSDNFMVKVRDGVDKARELWLEVLKTRFETGEPYMFFTDNVNLANPECYVKNGLSVATSNICSEIMLHTDPEHSFVCCLSSLNLSRWNEITDDDIYYSIYFLDAVLTEYIEKARHIKGMEAAVRSAEAGRAIGLGVLGWHTLLQSEGTPFGSFRATLLNRAIFARIREQAERATKDLAKEYGEPEWCKGFNRRNTHLLAVAPTVSNSILCGSVSQGIEPLIANCFAKKSAKGTFISKNSHLEAILETLDKNTPEVWSSIATSEGSVQHLPFLTAEQKEVFLTAYEIDQMVLINQAADRQVFIDQGQSLNLFFPTDVNPKYFHKVHFSAWEKGLKSLYYCRTNSAIKGDIVSRGLNEIQKASEEECAACEG